MKTTTLFEYGPICSGSGDLVRIVFEIKDSKIVTSNVFPGYNTQGLEDKIKHKTVLQSAKLLEQFDFDCSAPFSTTYCFLSVIEKSFEEPLPIGTQFMRALINEFSRIYVHLLCFERIATLFQFSPVLSTVTHLIKEVNRLFYLFEQDYSLYPFSFRRRFANDIKDNMRSVLNQVTKVCDYLEKNLLNNTIFKIRTVNLGLITKAECLAYSISGVTYRASGGEWDLRQSKPYDSYHHLDFKVPVGTHGDAYERYCVRLEEIRQSSHIITQCLDALSSDIPIQNEMGKMFFKENLDFKSSASLMTYVQTVSRGMSLPQKMMQGSIEGGRGETSIYVSIGKGAYSVNSFKIKTGSYYNLQAFESIVRGHVYSDIAIILASLDINMKEVDR